MFNKYGSFTNKIKITMPSEGIIGQKYKLLYKNNYCFVL